jgi:Siphovirus Gp157
MSENNLSLYGIEETLLGLTELRDAAVSQGDAETVAILDQEIEAYLTKEAAKVYSYAALIRQREDAAAICKARAEDLAARAKAMQADAARLKEMALRVMQRFQVYSLTAAEVTLRVQSNGGVKPVEIDPDGFIEPRMQDATVTMPGDLWETIKRAAQVPEQLLERKTRVVWTPNAARIREALEQQIACPRCSGTGQLCPAGPSDAPMETCDRCEGRGMLPMTVPGAKLLPRGSHLRVIWSGV